MVLPYYVYKYPYKFVWYLLRILGVKHPDVVCFISEPLDYILFESVQKFLPPIQLAAAKKARPYLNSRGINYGRIPSFPDAVIMFRHAAHKFPVKKIVKIGLRHGPYHFKKFTRASNYNAFDVFMMTSKREVEIGRTIGIKSAVSVGFPKLDPLFNGFYNETKLAPVRSKAGVDQRKKTIIFTATYNASGMSAIEKWIGELEDLSVHYNILVTVHAWISKKYVKRLKTIKNIYFIEDVDILPYLAVSDLLVGDVSSIIAEFCALDRPIVTFRVKKAKRSVPEIFDIIEDISIQIDDSVQLKEAIERGISDPGEKSEQRRKANSIIYDQLDGKAGKRAADIIKKWIPEFSEP